MRSADLFGDAFRDIGRGKAPLKWEQAAILAVVEAARELPQLTSDDVMDRIAARLKRGRDLRALGPVMSSAVRAGYIEKANVASIPSRRRSLHGSPRTVWTSLIHQGGAS
jgi:hypothetical protein